jgi:hypothetical protein
MNALELLEDRLDATLAEMGLEGALRHGLVTPLRSEHGVLLLSTFTRDDRPWLRVTSVLLFGFQPDLGLLQRVLQINNALREGGLRIFEDGVLAWSNSLHGEGLAPDTLHDTIRYAGWVADTYAPQLRALAGGHLGADLLKAQT